MNSLRLQISSATTKGMLEHFIHYFLLLVHGNQNELQLICRYEVVEAVELVWEQCAVHGMVLPRTNEHAVILILISVVLI